MAAERLVFDLLSNDKASAGFAAAGRAASAAADDVKGLQHRLDEISNKSASARVGLAGNKEALDQLDKLDVKLLLVGKRRANPNIKLDGALKANLEIAGISAELDKLNKKGADLGSPGGGLSKLQTALGGLLGIGGGAGGTGGAGASGGLPAIGASSGMLGGIAAALPVLGALLVETTGLVSGLAAAGAGVGAFGLLALPAFKKISTAYTAISTAQTAYNLAVAKENEDPTKANATAAAKALVNLHVAQENMGPSTRTAVTGIQGLVAEFDKMAKAFQPDVMKVFNDGLKIAHTLLPDLKPFADAAATAIDGLLKKAGKFTSSPGFQAWLAQFQKISGPAITAIGDGIGKIAISAGKLLTTMSAKDVVHSINIAFDTITGVINATAYVVRHLMDSWDRLSGGFAEGWKNIHQWGADLVTFFTVTIPAGLRLFRDEALLVWDHVEIDVLKMASSVTGTMGKLPGPLGAPFRAAHKDIAGELAGIQAAAATTAARINADWATLHGHTVSLNVKLSLPGGVSLGGRRLTGLAAGGRIPGYGGGDRHVIAVEGGETVVPKHLTPAVAPLMRAHGVPGFTAGGVVGSFTGGFPSAGAISADTRAMQAALGNLQAPLQLTQSAFSFPGPSAGGGHTGWNPGAGVSQWRRDSAAALRMLGLPAGDIVDVLYQMMTESGGNPNIVNRTDSNWLAGHPSVGLMQVIQGTFDAFAGPFRDTGPFSYGVSVNPMANIYAALNYGKHGRGFGTGPGQIGSGHGYDKGGWLPTGLSLAWNGTGRPEHVIPPGGGSGPVKVVLEVRTGHGATDMDRAIVGIIQKHVLATAGGDVQAALGAS